jgi:TrbL/VirB6 plasmid conjugal transfer protein
LLAILLLAAAATVLFAPAAVGIPSPIKFCDNDRAPLPEEPDAGTANLLVFAPPVVPPVVPIPVLREDPNSLYGRYGTAGQTWATYKLGCVDPGDLANSVKNLGANQLFDNVKVGVTFTLALQRFAFDPALLPRFAPLADQIVAGLRQSLYLEYLLPVLVLAGGWAVWHGFQQRTSKMSEGGLWMITAIGVSLWFFSHAGGVLLGANDLTVGVSDQIYRGMATVTGQGGPSGAVTDQLWRSLVYQPWVTGEFGRGQANDQVARRYGERLLAAQAYSYDEIAQLARNPKLADPKAPGSIANRKQDDYKQIAKELEANYPAAYAHFRGTQAGSRQGIAGLALVATFFVCLVLVIVGCANIVYQLAAVLLVCMAPAFLLLGIHPGVGRRIALRWLDMLAGAVLKRIFCSLLLSVLVMAYSIVLSPATQLSWGAAIVLTVLFGWAAWIYRKPFLRLFSSLSLSGAAGALESFHGERSKPLRTAFRAVLAYKTLRFLTKHTKRGAAHWPPVKQQQSPTAWRAPGPYVPSLAPAGPGWQPPPYNPGWQPPPYNPGAAANAQQRPWATIIRNVPNQPPTHPPRTVQGRSRVLPPRALPPPGGNSSGPGGSKGGTP